MREKLLTLERMDLVPVTNSFWSLFNLKKFEMNLDKISDVQDVREEGGSE